MGKHWKLLKIWRLRQAIKLKNKPTKPTFKEEEILWKKGFKYVIGIDEVGRGAFAGPVTAGAVAFNKNCRKEVLKSVNDSKQLKFMQRRKISNCICRLTLLLPINLIPLQRQRL